jgi:histone H2B
MAPKPASTAGKAPISSSTASKAPANSTEGVKATKEMKFNAPVDGEKKKTKKVRKEMTYSYIYKGESFIIAMLSYRPDQCVFSP